MLTQRIRDDVKTAMRAKDQVRLDTLRGALAAFTNELVAKGMKPTDEVTDELATTVLKRLSKQRKDAIEQFTKGGRQELADKEAEELKCIEEYLPQMASPEEIEKVAREKIAEMKADKSKMGQVIGAVMKQLQGNADGTEVGKIVGSLLS